MKHEHRLLEEPDVQPGDDVIPVPPPVDEEPPHDRFCDLVLTGGVASGVVYPWAIVEIARAFRFRNIGGTSVGAMAAALAAAAEYGRRTGFEKPFEALRRAPASLAKELPDGRTRMLSLFQTNPKGERLIRLWGALRQGRQDTHPGCLRKLLLVLKVYGKPVLVGALVGLVLALLVLGLVRPADAVACIAVAAWIAVVVVSLGLVALCAVLTLLWALWSDFRDGVIANEYGLCKGGSTGRPAGPSGIVEWLHKGIQASAGLDINTDAPLTFRDLWTAPAHPGAASVECGDDDAEEGRSINLQMITTNLTHGRPYRLPLNDTTSRLFYKREELEDYFPKCVLDALDDRSKPYAPVDKRPGFEPAAHHPTAAGLRELPRGDLPIVVAARLSLSFPLLFSAVPLWAIDYEVPWRDEGGRDVPNNEQRVLRRCMFSDGGVSSNFPVHLFDSALPRRPTFGLWLGRRTPYLHTKSDEMRAEEQEADEVDRKGERHLATEQKVWLPDHPDQGRADNWNRFDPQSQAPADHAKLRPKEMRPPPAKPGSSAGPGRSMLGFLLATAASATDWRDRTNFRLPHVRNRVARLLLMPDEGGLHIGMPRRQILDMAHRYGTVAGLKFVARFTRADGQPAQAWNEQRWTRFNLLIRGLRERLEGLARNADWSAYTVPMRQAIDRATQVGGPIRDGRAISSKEVDALQKALSELEQLDDVLRDVPRKVYNKLPDPEMRLRPPL